MEVFFETVFDKGVALLSTIDVVKLSVLVLILSLITSSFSVCIKTAVFGYPKPSPLLLFLYFTSSLFCYVVAMSGYFVGNGIFKHASYAFVYFIVMIIAITGLYAVFLKIAENVCDSFAPVKEATLTLDDKLAEILEEEDKTYGVSKVFTEKCGVKRIRTDDGINYFRLLEYTDKLKKRELSPIEKATLSVSESTVKRYKNTLITNETRRKLNDALSSVVKLYAKYEYRDE